MCHWLVCCQEGAWPVQQPGCNCTSPSRSLCSGLSPANILWDFIKNMKYFVLPLKLQGRPRQLCHMRPQDPWTPPLSCPEVIWPHRPNCHWWSPSHKPLREVLHFHFLQRYWLKLTSLFLTHMLGCSPGHESSSSGLASTSLAPPLTPLLATPPPATVSRLQLLISSSGTADRISWKKSYVNY